MRSIKFTIVLACLFVSLLHAETIVGRVVAVSDGDTIKVLDDTKKLFVIRLMGIDAPEKAQPFGQRSKQSLSDLVFHDRVEVQWNKLDRYSRVIGKVLRADGSDVCLEQLKRGMAWHYKEYAKDQFVEDRHKYDQAELVARETHIGLWADAAPTPPWMWRKSLTNEHQTNAERMIK
jgi:endonuclease YncB( thermonuclease family)